MRETARLPENREERVQYFVDRAEETAGMAKALRAGDSEAIVAFLELAPGAHLESVAIHPAGSQPKAPK